MKNALAALAVLALAGCASAPTTTDSRERSRDQQTEPNLTEAARINAQLGLTYLRKGELRIAEEKLKRAAQQDPKFALAYTGLGIVYSRRGLDDDADAAFKHALSLESDNPDTLNNYGSFLCAKGKTDKAEELFVRAGKNKDYAHPELAWTNAAVCLRTKQPDRAEKYLSLALQQNPNFPDALAEYGRITYEKGDYLRARAFLQRYEAYGPATPETLWLRYKTEGALGDVGAAHQYEQRLRTQFPEVQFSEAYPKP